MLEVFHKICNLGDITYWLAREGKESYFSWRKFPAYLLIALPVPTQKGFPALWGLQTLALTGSFQHTLSYDLYHPVCKLHHCQVMIQDHLKPIPVPHAKDYPSHPSSPSAPLPQAPISNKQPSSILGAVKDLMNFWPKCKSFPWSYRREKKILHLPYWTSEPGGPGPR